MKNEQSTFNNPILPGFYPDPSICRVGNDYYLVNSTFAYFPGIPVFHSQDLVHWIQVGNVIDRISQLNFEGLEQSRGIFAPTIRYNEGVYYVITTHVPHGGNFIVTATDPKGPWSDPYFLKNAEGIDPSLFFDEDGHVYYVGNRNRKEGARYFGDCEIWLQELDLKTMQLIGEDVVLWKGAMVDVVWPEGPHLYKKDGYYYLMIAEGGTSFEHAVTIARSKNLKGPYEGNRCNPILTHRHLGKDYPICNMGHADLVETENGDWWMVLLGSRPYGGTYSNMGRETFLVPVVWENDWPVVNPGKGIVEKSMPIPNLPYFQVPQPKTIEHFEDSKLDFKWLMIRTTEIPCYSLIERPGYLRLKLSKDPLTELGNVSFIGLRQQHMNYQMEAAMDFLPQNESEKAGLVLMQNHRFHFRFEYGKVQNVYGLRLIQTKEGVETILATGVVEAAPIVLIVIAKGQNLSFLYSQDEQLQTTILIENVDARLLSSEVAGGFIGTCMGMYASSNGVESNQSADFDWFSYTGK